MKTFMNENFLLENQTAETLYHEYAAKMPIIDYHCHLDPAIIANNHQFRSITELWLGGDHYKWRAMRANGIDESFITGKETSDWDKFRKWAETVPYTMRNPLYHWTHLELKTAFGITKLLNKDTAREIYDECNEKLQSPEFSARNLMKHYEVEVVCTTDDPVDSLEYHKKIQEDQSFEIKVLPTWRPDKCMTIENPQDFKTYLQKLSHQSDIEINTYNDLIEVLQKRHNYFASLGCIVSDHGTEEFYNEPYTQNEIQQIFNKVYKGNTPDTIEIKKFKSALLTTLAEMNWAKGWTQQYHYGALRNNNNKMYHLLGADTGYDSIGEPNTAKNLSGFLNNLEAKSKLTKTILYNLNPSANEMIATMAGNFQDGTIPGKIQFGAAWWFLDQKDGIEKQLNTLSVLGLISRFIGMLTDSRSFLSYPRHEYFRRILCNLYGKDIENGELPADIPFIGKTIQDICYHNAKNYFGF